jgi:hypothetical protein
MKIRNYFRRRYQRTRHIVFYGGLNLLNRVIAKQLAEHRNAKWASFLRTLHPNNAPLWKVTRYCKKSRDPIPPLVHHEKQYYVAEDKAGLLAEHFESNHGLTTPQTLTHHAREVDRLVETFLKRRGQDVEDPPPITHTEVTQTYKEN